MPHIFCLLALSLLLTGCMVGPNFHIPEPPDTSSYTEQSLPEKTVATETPGGTAQHLITEAEIPAEWWRLFQSPALNDLIIRAIANNPTLQAAEATLRQAEENLRAQIGGTLLPKFTGTFTADRIQDTAFDTTTGITAPGFAYVPGPFNLYNASVNVSYTLDVFGGLRRNIEYFRAEAEYERYELLAAYLTLTSNVVTTSITEASLREQIKATKELVRFQEEQLAIITKQYQVGGVANLNVLTQETTLEQTRALLPPLEKSLAQTRDALAVLVGDPPSEAYLPDFKLNDLILPSELPVSLPSSLVQQRPDIGASEALLHAACAQIGVATANLLPSFNITGYNGTEASTPIKLFGPGTAIWELQGQVMQTIFNGGALLAQRRAAIANYDIAFAQYRQTVLNALQNVADTLQVLELDAKALKINFAAEQAAKKALLITSQQYKVGGVSYLSLITADQQYQQAYLNLIIAQAARYTDTAALFQSMGGGWWNEEIIVEDDIFIESDAQG